MCSSQVKSARTLVVLITLMILSSELCAVFVQGQGGTGRETSNANANKAPASSKRKLSPRKPRSTTRSSAPTTNPTPPNSDTPKADDASAIERMYWETIRLSADAEDFKSYLKKYPNGQFAGLARDNLTRLETAGKPQLKRDSAGRIILDSLSGSTPGAKPAPKPGSIFRNQIGMEFVYVPAGTFMMGAGIAKSVLANRALRDPKANEKPEHEVTIKEGFYLGRYEVTQAEWQQVMGTNPSYNKGDRLPVDQVSWDNAQSFISKLNESGDGFRYRLPSEAEWEYACRAGTTGDHAGDVREMAWFLDNSRSRTHPVGEKRPNDFGLYDMHGNVHEWCGDAYHGSYEGAPVDGSAWLSGGEQNYRVLRGGAFNSEATFLRSAARGKGPANRDYSFGFRVVAVVRN